MAEIHPLVKGMAPWFIRGKVIHGHGRGGTKLGYPTANIELDAPTIEKLQPFSNLVLFGYGCVEPMEEGEKGLGPFPIAMSVGFNPHFKDVSLTAEAHFMHRIPCDFYSHMVRIIALGVIREQSAFTTLEALIRTIDGDLVEIKRRLVEEPILGAFERHQFVQPEEPPTAEVAAKVPYFYQEQDAQPQA